MTTQAYPPVMNGKAIHSIPAYRQMFRCSISFAWIILVLLGSSAHAEHGVSITTDKKTYSPSDRHHVRIGIDMDQLKEGRDESFPYVPVSIYFAIILPDGQAYSLGPEWTFETDLVPFRKYWTMHDIPKKSPFCYVDLDASLPQGEYIWFMILCPFAKNPHYSANWLGWSVAYCNLEGGFDDGHDSHRFKGNEYTALLPYRQEDKDIAELTPLKLIRIPAGTFMMGAPADDRNASNYEKPQFSATLHRAFYMSAYELTNAQWNAVMPDLTTKNCYVGGKATPNHPFCISFEPSVIEYYHIPKFVQRMNGITDVPPGYRYTLPTAAQWEYACRAGSTTLYPFGDDAAALGENAWYQENAGADKIYGMPVGTKQPNAWGLYDMIGNVLEPTKEIPFHINEHQYATLPFLDPNWVKPNVMGANEMRGGNVLSSVVDLRSSTRNKNKSPVGIRLCLEPFDGPAGPAFTPPHGTATNDSVTVTITPSDPKHTVYFKTADSYDDRWPESPPTTSSTRYNAPLTFTKSQLILAIAVDENGKESLLRMAYYTVNETEAPVVAAIPTGGALGDPHIVTLSGSDNSGVPPCIYYTLDGSSPTKASSKYQEPIKLESNTTVKYFGVDIHGNESAIQSATYTVSAREGENKWAFGLDGPVFASPTVDANGVVYIGTKAGTLYAIHPDGTLKWSFKTNGEIRIPAAISHEWYIIIAAENDQVYVLDQDGKKLWSGLSHCSQFSPIAVGPKNRFYVAAASTSRDAALYCYQIKHPSETWFQGQFRVGKTVTFPELWKQHLDAIVQSFPVVDSDRERVYAGCSNKIVYAISTAGSTPSVLWQTYAGVNLSGPALGADGTLYIGGIDGALYAIDPDGKTLWTYRGGSMKSSPAIGADGTIYIGSEDKMLHAIRPDGSRLWAYLTDGEIRSSPAVDSNGIVYVGSNDGYLYAVNRGQLAWRESISAPTSYFFSSPTLTRNGLVYIGSCTQNQLLCLRKKQGGPADSSWPMLGQGPAHTSRVRGEVFGEILTIDLPLPAGSVPLKMKRVPTGSFWMGRGFPAYDLTDTEKNHAASPRHRVTISQDFYVGVCELTNAQWRSVMGDSPEGLHRYHYEQPNPAYIPSLTSNAPLCTVKWEAGEAMIDALNRKGYAPAGYRFALPTEAQWEYMARAGTDTRFPFGDNYRSLIDFSHVGEKWNVNAVASMRPNFWGIYDTVGNVLEGCRDAYAKDYYRHSPDVDPLNLQGENHVARGYYQKAYSTSFSDWSFADNCQIQMRYSVGVQLEFGTMESITGFRLVLVKE